MTDANKVRGYTGALPPPEPDKESEIDPEKFKKILKVEESGESEKREKRRLSKQEEEGEDEEVQGDDLDGQVKSSAFSEFMSDQEKVDSVFDAKGVQGQVRQDSAERPTPFSMISETELPPTPEENPPEEPAKMIGNLEGTEPSGKQTRPSESAPKKTEAEPQTAKSAPNRPTQQAAKKPKEIQTDASLLAGKTKKGALKSKKPEKEKAPIFVQKNKQPEKAIPQKQIEPSLSTEEAAVLIEPELPPEKKKEKIDTSSLAIEGKEVAPESTPNIAPTTAAPAYTKLNPQVFELFEKMVGLITIQKDTGVTTTTITINMKNSVFDGSEIVLEHYSTAPNSFNIRLQAAPEAVALLSANMTALVESFKQTTVDYSVNVLPPTLQKKYRIVKRRGKEKDQDKEQE
ncbi:MAG: hypothetical protein KAR79_00395 [Simkaniaceae bacterium]|nr:hypothetical protein [Simkaniaceae bacterium]